ncbi:hypothetical protein IP81_07245 [Novosphingobium sp. AAP83]|uniref:TonB-dependent receptor n=1 Tax=Novosphingobium sp. AAP83 TaxID=1523425 RepID=UPI0006B8ED32|nr:TonB-dependent receptor [Novosphingobium sp. AAP83]KPF91862.1 hypothetical protein IP81_07245 [Novosphingobium sp. AAP83]
MIKTNAIGVLMTGVGMLAIAQPALAQASANPQPAADAVSDADIIVTARRRNESVQDVPATVQAVTADTIEKLNLRKLEDIQAVVPGLNLVANTNGIGATSTIRGVDYSVNASGNNGTIEFYLNDSPLAAGVLFQSMFDLGQIEVLRGPQGTLKGRSTPSGSISISTRKPDLDAVGGMVNATANNIGGYNVNAALNIPVVAGKLGIRVAGISSDDDGSEVRPLNDAQALRNEGQGIRASVRADPFDGVLLLDLMYQGFRRKSLQYNQVESFNRINAAAGASPVAIRAEDRRAVDGFPIENDQRFKVYSGSAQLALAGQRLTYTGLHLKQDFVSLQPSDNAGIFVNDSVTSAGVTSRFGPRTQTNGKSTSHEIRLQNDDRVAGIFDYVIGYLDYKTSSPSVLTRAIGISVVNNPVLGTRLLSVAQVPVNRGQETQEKSFFGNISAQLGDSLEISGGLRRVNYKAQSNVFVRGVEQTLATLNLDESKTIYSGSIRYKVSDDVLVYANTGTSFRPSNVAVGGILALLAPTPTQGAFFRSQPETSRSYEVGFKADLLDKRLRFNLAAFHQKFDNYPFLAPGAGVIVGDAFRNSVTTAPLLASVPVTAKGIEAELQANPIDGLTFGAVMSYAKGQINNGQLPCLDVNRDGIPDTLTTQPTFAQINTATGGNLVSVCPTNQRSNSAPLFNAALTSEYTASVSRNVDGYFRGLFTYNGASQTDPVNAFDDQGAFGILNLYLGVRDPDGAWEVSLFGKNITNTFKVLNRSNGAIQTELQAGVPLGGGLTSSGSSSLTNYSGDLRVTAPREFGINLRWAFGSR